MVNDIAANYTYRNARSYYCLHLRAPAPIVPNGATQNNLSASSTHQCSYRTKNFQGNDRNQFFYLPNIPMKQGLLQDGCAIIVCRFKHARSYLLRK